MRYSAAKADFFDDVNMEPGPVCTQPQPCDWHPRIENVVYHGMDWNCPTYTRVLGEKIQEFYGQLTPENIISDVIAKVLLRFCQLHFNELKDMHWRRTQCCLRLDQR